MFDFFNELMQSELMKNNRIMFCCLTILLISVGIAISLFYMKHFYLKAKDNEINKLKLSIDELRENLANKNLELEETKNRLQLLSDRHLNLISQAKKLEFLDEQYLAENVDKTDKALAEFLK